MDLKYIILWIAFGVLSIIIGVSASFGFFKKDTSTEIVVSRIKEEYRGVVVERFSYHKNLEMATHLRINTKEKGLIEICPSNELIVRESLIGDSIIKIGNENRLILKRNNGVTREYFYTRIPNKTRLDETFPKEWKNKWPESSYWDQ